MSLELAHTLIKERELVSGNLNQAEQILLESIQASPTARAYGLLAEIQYWRGEVASKDDKISIYEKGIVKYKKGRIQKRDLG